MSALAFVGIASGADEPPMSLPLVGYNEHRSNSPGGRHANVSTNRAMVVKADGTERRPRWPGRYARLLASRHGQEMNVTHKSCFWKVLA